VNHFSSKLNEEEIGKIVLDSAFKVHTVLGPGLLESVYEAALTVELGNRGLSVERQVPIAVNYEGHRLEVGYRADMVVERIVLIEIKSVEAVIPLFKKITTNYLKLIPLKLGFLINFNEVHLKNGITRVVNGLEGKPFFHQTNSLSMVDLKEPSPSSRPSRDS